MESAVSLKLRPITLLLYRSYLVNCITSCLYGAFEDVAELEPAFVIGYIAPTYSQLMAVFYVLTFVVGGQLISFFVYNSNKH